MWLIEYGCLLLLGRCSYLFMVLFRIHLFVLDLFYWFFGVVRWVMKRLHLCIEFVGSLKCFWCFVCNGFSKVGIPFRKLVQKFAAFFTKEIYLCVWIFVESSFWNW